MRRTCSSGKHDEIPAFNLCKTYEIFLSQNAKSVYIEIARDSLTTTDLI